VVETSATYLAKRGQSLIAAQWGCSICSRYFLKTGGSSVHAISNKRLCRATSLSIWVGLTQVTSNGTI
jgi:hypothetical protein